MGGGASGSGERAAERGADRATADEGRQGCGACGNGGPGSAWAGLARGGGLAGRLLSAARVSRTGGKGRGKSKKGAGEDAAVVGVGPNRARPIHCTCKRRSARVLLHGHDLLVVHGAEHGHHKGLALVELRLDGRGQVLRVVREHQVLLLVAGLRVHEAKEAIVTNVEKGVLLTRHVGHQSPVRRGHHVLELLAVEDVNRHKVGLGVAVLARLGRGHGDHLARAALDHDVTPLADLPGVHGDGGGGARRAPLEVIVLHLAALLGHGGAVRGGAGRRPLNRPRGAWGKRGGGL
mmetsp:Transcript_15163/g.51380  ORF Transcript_15163/g.51380 Transcript_15163/m.51380 type:complete len:292 (-) Transcript_15163:13-888(-)